MPTETPRKTSHTPTRVGARAALAAAVLAVAALAIGGCGGGGEERFATPTYPFSFDYPDDWKISRNVDFSFGSANAERQLAAIYRQPYDQVTISQYKLRKTLPEGTNGNRREVDTVVERLTEQADGTSSEGKEVEFGGVPGYQYVTEYATPDEKMLQNTLTFLFKGRDEFLIICQSSEPNREKLNEGCNQILDTIQFTG